MAPPGSMGPPPVPGSFVPAVASPLASNPVFTAGQGYGRDMSPQIE